MSTRQIGPLTVILTTAALVIACSAGPGPAGPTQSPECRPWTGAAGPIGRRSVAIERRRRAAAEGHVRRRIHQSGRDPERIAPCGGLLGRPDPGAGPCAGNRTWSAPPERDRALGRRRRRGTDHGSHPGGRTRSGGGDGPGHSRGQRHGRVSTYRGRQNDGHADLRERSRRGSPRRSAGGRWVRRERGPGRSRGTRAARSAPRSERDVGCRGRPGYRHTSRRDIACSRRRAPRRRIRLWPSSRSPGRSPRVSPPSGRRRLRIVAWPDFARARWSAPTRSCCGPILERASQATAFTSDGGTWTLYVRPLLPDELGG